MMRVGMMEERGPQSALSSMSDRGPVLTWIRYA